MAEGQYAVMVDKDTHKKIKLFSVEVGKSMGEVVRIAVEKLKIKEVNLKADGSYGPK